MSLATRIYRLTLVLLPRDFRQRHAEEMLDTFGSRCDAAAGAPARLSVLLRESVAVVPVSLGAFADGLPPSLEPLLSLVPGREPRPLAEPTGRGRRVAMRQFGFYPELDDLDWDASWRAWSAAWPAIARDPAIRALRWLTMGSIALAAGGSAVAASLLIGEPVRAAPWLIVMVALAPPVAVLVIGVPVARLTRPAIIRCVRPHLAEARRGLADG